MTQINTKYWDTTRPRDGRKIHSYIWAIVLFFLFCPNIWATTIQLQADETLFDVEQIGSCDPINSLGSQSIVAWSGDTGLWRLNLIRPLPASDESLILYLSSPFYFEAAVKTTTSLNWMLHIPQNENATSGWPAAVAAFPIGKSADSGNYFEICLSGKLPARVKAKITTKDDLRSSVFKDIRLSSLTEGTLFAITLAALGLSLLIQRMIFLVYAGGLAMALLFVVASNGSLLEWSGGVWLAREFPIQRIAGIGATILVSWGLAQFLSFDQRHPRVWRLFVTLLAIMCVLLLMDLSPTPLRYVSFSVYSNAIMAMLIVLLLGSAVVGIFQRHRASFVLLISWGPVMFVSLWMSTNPGRESSWTSFIRWLFTAALVFACSFLFTELARRLAETQAQRDAARKRATTDHLTGALTRDALFQELDRIHADAVNGVAQYSVLFVDLDHFKKVNDTFGHPIGDTALIAAMQRIMSVLRTKDRVGRYGGEEFLVLLKDIDAESACKIGERICADIANNGESLEDLLPPLTVSIGIATFRAGKDDNSAVVIERADKALYVAKQKGRNRVEIAD